MKSINNKRFARIHVILGILLVVSITVGTILWQQNRTRINMDVLSQIYELAPDGVTTSNFVNIRREFNKIDEVRKLTVEDVSEIDFQNSLTIDYIPNNMHGMARIWLSMPSSSERKLVFGGSRDISKTITLNFSMEYQAKASRIIVRPLELIDDTAEVEIINDTQQVADILAQYRIRKGDIRSWQDYILYDVIIASWAHGHGGSATFAINDARRRYVIED